MHVVFGCGRFVFLFHVVVPASKLSRWQRFRRQVPLHERPINIEKLPSSRRSHSGALGYLFSTLVRECWSCEFAAYPVAFFRDYISDGLT